MGNKEQTVELLQNLLNKLLAGAQMHFMHAKINEQKGFSKLASRMLEEYNEEMDSVAEVMKHISRLGGSIAPSIESYPIHCNIEEQILSEYTTQTEGVAELEQMIKNAELDLATENFLNDYFDDEVEHAEWLTQQVNLINTIGIQNYLATQI